MFKLAEQPDDYSWPVEIQIPQDGGRYTTAEFDARFRILPQSEIDAIIETAQNGTGQDEALMSRVLIGWARVEGEDGGPLAYSEEAKRALLDIPYVRIGIARAFFNSIRGRERQRKN